MTRITLLKMQQNFFTLTGVKYVLGMVMMGAFAFSIMSFSSFSDINAPAPGKDKKVIKAKKGPKGFVTLLPAKTGVTLDPTTEGLSTATTATAPSEVKVALNDKVKDFADNYISKEYTDLTKMKVWAKPIFNTMDKILTEYNLPTQLKYIAVIESSLSKNMRMSSGALGPWQLMPDEAVRYGLRKNGHDYRTDYAKSTVAAAKLLTSLHNRYHDWLLTIAAYNAGVGGVNRAISKAGSTDFWKVQRYLPQETRNEVKKFISTHYFFEGSGGITTMSAKETKKYKREEAQDLDGDLVELNPSSNNIRIKGIYNKEAICKVLDISQNVFDKDNPNFDKALADGQFYDMHLPDGKAASFVQNKDEILRQCFNQLLNDSNNKEALPKNRTKIDR
ncbi:MAG: lytic transglycosylase domain-containing protein [Arachidicoccus sp.]